MPCGIVRHHDILLGDESAQYMHVYAHAKDDMYVAL